MISPNSMHPFSRALSDFHSGSLDAAFTIHRDDGFCQRVTAATFFETEHFPPLELLALDECRGKILDVGSAVGRHSLELVRRGHLVTSLDVLPEMEGIMKARGQTDVVIADVSEFSGKRFDTLLMLMNGIGIVGSIGGLKDFLRHAHELVLAGGQILCDSIDVSITTDPQHVSYRERNLSSGRPAGQQSFTMECDGEEPVAFDWMHIDFNSLARVASSLGWKAEMLQEENDGHYLCRLCEN
jgi:SAM-dependent methyltransferase